MIKKNKLYELLTDEKCTRKIYKVPKNKTQLMMEDLKDFEYNSTHDHDNYDHNDNDNSEENGQCVQQ